MIQSELQLTTAQPHASSEDVAALMELLRGRGWMKASEITAAHGARTSTSAVQSAATWTDRKIRSIASESGGRILSSDKGYKLTIDCTPEEERHARERLLSQARVMQQRAVDIAKVFHQSA